MKNSSQTLEFQFERMIPAAPEEVFDAWLNPNNPGTPWHEGDKVIIHPQVDGLFYWRVKEKSIYGRFIEIERPGRLQHTWVSPNTLGKESTVTVTFQKKDDGTLMTLLHTGLPDDELAKGHEAGWGSILDKFLNDYGSRTSLRK